MAAGVSVEQHRAQLEQDAHADEEPADREHSLEWCRLLLSRYGGADQLDELPLETAGPCDDCATIVDVRWVDFYNKLRAGNSAQVTVAVHVAGAKTVHRRDSEGDVDAVVQTKSLVITDILLD